MALPFHPLPVPPRSRRGGFSLLELLFAIFILAIGIIICATIFPVAGDWTRQTTEHDVAQNVARNAVATLQSELSPLSLIALTDKFVPASGLGMDASRRAYAYGSDHPDTRLGGKYSQALYFWDALLRHRAAEPDGSVDALVLVFKKGETAQRYGLMLPPAGYSSSVNLLPDQAPHVDPALWLGPYRDGSEIPVYPSPPFNPKVFPPIGDYGIGEHSGTVFRQRLSANAAFAAPSSPLVSFDGHVEKVFYAAPADGTDASPLVYVYPTILTF